MNLDSHFAGVTLSPPKASRDDMKRIVSECRDRLDRIMCNTDSGSEFYEDLVKYSRTDDMDSAACEMIFFQNAVRFYKIG